MSLGITNEDVDSIISLISKNNISACIAPTGSGKSTLLVSGIEKKAGARIFVSQPTVVAVMSLVDRMKNTLYKDDPDAIGSAYEGQVNYTDKSRIVYCTTRDGKCSAAYSCCMINI